MSEKKFIVSATQTAKVMGSGDLDVLATPALVAMLENTASHLLKSQLTPQQSSVGIHIQLDHLQASLVGTEITCRAVINEQQKNRVFFLLTAYEGETKIAEGRHTRAIIETARFLSRLNKG